MLTVFILANDDAKALTRTLNALVGATVDGLVRDVVMLGEPDNTTASILADDAGCTLIAPTQFASAVQSAKGDWLLLLEGGALLEQNWAEAASNHIQMQGGAAHFTRSPLAPRTLLKRLFQRERPLALGLLISKHAALSLGGAAISSPENLAKALQFCGNYAALG